jgi:hypothetical protein
MYSTKHAGYLILVMYSVGCHVATMGGGGEGGLRYGISMSTFFIYISQQCSGSVTFWYVSESGSAELYLYLTDPSPDPAQDPDPFVSNLQDANKNYFFASYFLKVHLHHSSQIQSHKTAEIGIGIKFNAAGISIKADDASISISADAAISDYISLSGTVPYRYRYRFLLSQYRTDRMLDSLAFRH